MYEVLSCRILEKVRHADPSARLVQKDLDRWVKTEPLFGSVEAALDEMISRAEGYSFKARLFSRAKGRTTVEILWSEEAA